MAERRTKRSRLSGKRATGPNRRLKSNRLPPKEAFAPEKAKEAPPPEPMGPPPPPKTWSALEIDAGLRDCERRLAGLRALYTHAPPIREGVCGLPAPIWLSGFESERAPDMYFLPAATTSCKMAEALRRWFDAVVQPKAKAYLHATIVRIRTLSDYDCRMRYDDPAQRISQHAYANALDIGEFITAKGERIAVEDAWNAGDERAAFLRDIHDGACEIFGTALGPDANAAHRNHFHFDMTPRRRPLCDFTPAQFRDRERAKKDALVPVTAQQPPAAPVAKPLPPVPVSEVEEHPRRKRRHRSLR